MAGVARMLDGQLKAQTGNERTSPTVWDVIGGGFNSWLREAIGPMSSFLVQPPDYWLNIWSPRSLTDNPRIHQQLEMFLSSLHHIYEQNAQLKTRILVTSFVVDPVMPQPLYQTPFTMHLAHELNDLLFKFEREHGFFHVLDMQSLFTRFGLQNLTDARFEAMGRMYFSPTGAGHVARFLSRGLFALRDVPSKVLVLDLDNTLWGGILGEDGFNGIKVGGEGLGYLFTRFQQAVLALKNNGVLLAVCSKNDESEALKVFREHPDMILRLDDISAYQINWEPKAVNVQRLAQELNVGIDSLVLFDDSAFERENVRQMIPEVKVIDVPDDPSLYIQALCDFPGFDTFRVTEEDRKRARQYSEEVKRRSLKQSSSSLEEFYRSLEMKATLTLADGEDLVRVHQLIWKTNQFNLTTQRLEESALREMLTSENYEIIMLRLKDKMGESGITGVVVLQKDIDGQSHIWEIQNLMLSCRIIGRTVEYALMRALARRALQYGARELHASFIPSGRNQVAEKFLEQAGFSLQGICESGIQKWKLLLADAETKIPADFVPTTVDMV
jgi:FkbH-like protein